MLYLGNSLKLRTEPVQARAKETVEKILGASLALLREGGPDALSTSAVAKASGLNLRNVYRYFPNKLAIYAALNDRINLAIEQTLINGSLFEQRTGYEEIARKAVQFIVDMAEREPAIFQVRAAMRTSPELQQSELEHDKRLAAKLAVLISKDQNERDLGIIEAKALVCISAIGAVMDRLLTDSSLERDLLIDALCNMIGWLMGDEGT